MRNPLQNTAPQRPIMFLMFGLQSIFAWIFVDLWICGFVDLWICGFVDLFALNSEPGAYPVTTAPRTSVVPSSIRSK